jgi:hypothetical protein
VKHLSDSFFLSKNGLNQGDASLPIHIKLNLEFSIRKVQENQVGLKLNGTHQLLAYAHNVNLVGDNADTMGRKKNKETLIGAGKEVGLESNVEKTKFMLMSCHLIAGQDHVVETTNR